MVRRKKVIKRIKKTKNKSRKEMNMRKVNKISLKVTTLMKKSSRSKRIFMLKSK